MTLLGNSTLAVRLVQAAMGALAAVLVVRLARATAGAKPALLAGWIVALHPYAILGSVILLSEALFGPLMLLALWGLAWVWEGRGGGWAVALGTGVAAGAAVLTRPSWGLFVPMAVVAMLIRRRFRRPGLGSAALIGLGLVLVMAPWWVRNEQVHGRFVPTALWLGASLYDGLNPLADGSSDMSFMAHDDIWPLDEEDQDRELTHRALAFVREHPRRALELAANKLGLYWRPWPQATGITGVVAMGLGGMVELPLLLLMVVGLWEKRRDGGAWVLLAGPILYFCVVHLVFASSMRYRLPGEPAALVLAAVGLERLKSIFDF